MRTLEVALDCDGVLSDFVHVGLDILEKITGKRYRHEDVRTWDIMDSFEEHRDIKKVFYDHFLAPGICRGMPVLAGAKEGVKALSSLARVFVVTSPFRPSLYWMVEREEWLYDHFEIRGKDVVHCSRKHRIKADVFVDDRPENVEEWQEAHPDGAGVLWDMPYNQGSKHLPRVSSWGGLHQMVSSLVSNQKRVR